ncbi:MAG: hypothetical protein KDC99_19340 [Cyclobacteriaceae bacterium]|nr:hypothetical protein [Cyclobacteriaceae bacterium]
MKSQTSLIFWLLTTCVVFSCERQSDGYSSPLTFENVTHWKTVSWVDAVVETSDGVYLIAGQTNGNIFLSAFNSHGDSLWVKELNVSDRPFALFEQDDGNINIFAARSFVKTNSVGDIVFTKLWPDRLYPVSAKRSMSGNYLIVGETDSSSVGLSSAYFLAEVDPMGTPMWTLSIPGPHGLNNTYYNYAWSLLENGNNGIIVAGTEYFATEPVGATVIMQVGGNGYEPYKLAWQKTYPSLRLWRPYLFRQEAASLVIAGEESNGKLNLLSATSSGDSIKTIQTIDIDVLQDAIADHDPNHLALLSTRQITIGNSDVFLTKVTLQGDTLWSRSFGGPGNEWCYKTALTSDGGYIMVGIKDGGIYLIKVNSAGQLN